jgi:uncharacterized membrane protein YkoI
MRRRTRWIAAAGLAVAMTGVVAAAAIDGDSDQELPRSTRDRAVAAALAATGGGTVLETQVGDDSAAYAVEVRRGDGHEVEVDMDRTFRVIAQEPDDDTAGGEGSR